ncbi:YrzE family protein [Candidatus Pantoea edessiphila]|uniref:Uncharacterized protein n=1 Tax=Candidatus Pantoea edessiphila TaxID=2044610 RepID=A0A2P5SWH7_9GAMM|nr:YrzE family protein [Candidatus Pantoea edessiphila]PPI86674.1 hypothetical protein CRV10_00205 [Candidatus Pantoea edessiphila]
MFDRKIHNDSIEKVAIERTTSNFIYDSISWSAVFTGVIFTLMLHVLLSTLGAAIGATSINLSEHHLTYLGSGALIWISLTMLISVSIGSYIAGSLARCKGSIHGLLVFSLSTLITLWLAFSFTGSIFTNILNVANASFKDVANNIHSKVLPLINKENERIVNKFNYNTNNSLDDKQKNLKQILHQEQDYNITPSRFINMSDYYKIYHIILVNWLHQQSHNNSNSHIQKDFTKISKLSNTEFNNNINNNEKNCEQEIKETTQDQYNSRMSIIEQQTIQVTSKASWFTFTILIVEGLLAGVLGMLGYKNQFKKL